MEDDVKAKIIQAIKSYMNKNGYSREEFSNKLAYSKSTLDKILTGDFNDKRLERIERRIGENLRGADYFVTKSRREFGAYNKEDHANLVGKYAFYRVMEKYSDKTSRSVFYIEWNQPMGCLELVDKNKKFLGPISIPKESISIFIPSNEEGWCRLLIISKLDDTGEMRGSLTTMGRAVGGVYMPAIYPVLFVKAKNPTLMELELTLGDADYEPILKKLKEVSLDRYVTSFLEPVGGPCGV